MILVTDLTKPLTFVGSAALHTLGVLYFEDATAKVFRYVVAEAALTNNTTALKEALSWGTTGNYYVSNDATGGTGRGQAAPAGIAISSMAQGYFGWIQVGGVAAVTGDGTVAASEAVTLHATTDGGCDTMADGTEEMVIGVALGDDGEDPFPFDVLLKGLY